MKEWNDCFILYFGKLKSYNFSLRGSRLPNRK